MKKRGIIVAGLTLIMSIGLCTTCFAAGVSAEEQKVLDAIKSVSVAENVEIKLPDKYYQQAEKFLTTNELSDAAIKDVLAKVEDAKKVVKEAVEANDGKTSVADLKKLVADDAATAKKIADAANAVGKAAGVELKVTLTDGELDYAFENTDGSTIKPSDSVIKNTGFGMGATAAVAVLGVAVLGGCVAVARKNDLFAKEA